jgi:hypothetical protein
MTEACNIDAIRALSGRGGGAHAGVGAVDMAAHTLLSELGRRDARRGLATMCIGAGSAIATVIAPV